MNENMSFKQNIFLWFVPKLISSFIVLAHKIIIGVIYIGVLDFQKLQRQLTLFTCNNTKNGIN